MTLNGYEKLWSINVPYDPSGLNHFKFSNTTYQADYDLFLQRIRDSIGKKFLPIYRMADGEFMFTLKKYLLKKVFYSYLSADYNIFSTCWGEGYTRKEIKNIFPLYIEQLQKIAEKGFFAIHFIESKENSYLELMEPMLNWFAENNISLNETNYSSFYYIYALFSGPHKKEILEGKNILIISNITNEKESILRANLLNIENAANVEFYQISSNKSFFEKLDLSKIKLKIDIALIGAGVGSSNILSQLEPLNTVCIDAGIVIDLLANPELRFSRLFLNFNP